MSYPDYISTVMYSLKYNYIVNITLKVHLHPPTPSKYNHTPLAQFLLLVNLAAPSAPRPPQPCPLLHWWSTGSGASPGWRRCAWRLRTTWWSQWGPAEACGTPGGCVQDRSRALKKPDTVIMYVLNYTLTQTTSAVRFQIQSKWSQRVF